MQAEVKILYLTGRKNVPFVSSVQDCLQYPFSNTLVQADELNLITSFAEMPSDLWIFFQNAAALSCLTERQGTDQMVHEPKRA